MTGVVQGKLLVTVVFNRFNGVKVRIDKGTTVWVDRARLIATDGRYHFDVYADELELDLV